MKLRLYVEDRYFQTYEILATKWHQTSSGRVSQVKAVTLGLDRMRDFMCEYVYRARRDGFDCVVFVLDREEAYERAVLIREVRAAFERLCQELPTNRELQDVRVGLVIVKSCLECWLLVETQAIVRFACRRGRRVSYTPPQRGDTEQLSPNEAVGEITHILREVARQAGRHDVKRIKYEKSAIPDMVQQMTELPQALSRNHSLSYFCDMITCERSGCDHPQPDNEF